MDVILLIGPPDHVTQLFMNHIASLVKSKALGMTHATFYHLLPASLPSLILTPSPTESEYQLIDSRKKYF